MTLDAQYLLYFCKDNIAYIFLACNEYTILNQFFIKDLQMKCFRLHEEILTVLLNKIIHQMS